MNQVTTALRQLEAYVQEEIGAQLRLLERLEAQDLALRSHDPLRIAHTTRALDTEIEGAQKRAQRRHTILAGLADVWGLASSSLSLSSVAERVGDDGDDGERLERQKQELERISKRVQKLARRNTTVARFHQRLTSDVLQAVLVQDDGGNVHDGGALVDAEA
ncbi:MAG: flagellar export chaperone FlgN [Planctomycetes bacterium]|nr:flagellar export chaperone FlgN [Planctomycetota bacterium]